MTDQEDEVSREDILARTTPEDLFGIEALRNPRALKRAYAKLIRRFGPDHDAEAFRHVRAVYERARYAPPSSAGKPNGNDPLKTARLETLAVDSDETRTAHPDPVAELEHALQAHDWVSVAHHVDHAAGPIVQAAPDVWLEAAWTLTETQLFDTPTPQLRRRLETLEWNAAFFDLTTLLEVEELVLIGISFNEAASDPHVSASLLDAIRSTWSVDTLAAAKRWSETSASLSASVDLHREARHLQLYHPLVFRCLIQVNERISDATSTHRSWLTGELPRTVLLNDPQLRKQLSPDWADRAREMQQFIRPSLAVMAALGAGVASVSLLGKLFPLGGYGLLILPIAVGLISLKLVDHLAPQTKPPPSRWSAALRDQVVRCMRSQTLWPHEIVNSVIVDWESTEFGPGRTLLDIEQDGSLILASMTRKHVDRVSERLQQEAAPS